MLFAMRFSPRGLLLAGTLLAILAHSLPTSATGGIYYISPDGSDATGNGSADSPWATLGHATSRMPDDGSTLVVKDGLYVGTQSIGRAFTQTAFIEAENPYAARFRSPETNTRALQCYSASNVHLSGLEFFGSGSTGSEYVMHVSTPAAYNLTFENCIIHDSYSNDLVKVNNQAHDITFRGCLVYNADAATGSYQLFDINTVKDITLDGNIFLMDLEGSGRENNDANGAFIVVKNSSDTLTDYTERITISGNVFHNYQGKADQSYVLIGEDGKPFFEAQDVLVENNLLLFDPDSYMMGAFMVKGGAKDVTFRANTVVGQIKYGGGAYGMQAIKIGSNPDMENIAFYNNIFSDSAGRISDFSDGDPNSIQGLEFLSNVYYNGGQELHESDGSRLFDPATDDPAGVFEYPGVPNPGDLTIARWDPKSASFLSGETTIESEFRRLVETYAKLPRGSVAIDAAAPEHMPATDILGRPWVGQPNIGAYQMEEEILPGDLNSDGTVGSADLDIVRSYWGATVIPGDFEAGDASGDGSVGSADLDVIRGNWGRTASAATAASAAAVPEPGALAALTLLGLFGILLRNGSRAPAA